MSEAVIGYVQAVCNGDTEALAKLFTTTLRPSYYLALKLCGNREEAVEVTKKAYAKAFCTITKLKKPEAFEIWVRQNITTVYKDSRSFVFDDAVAGAPETTKEFLSSDVFKIPAKASAALAALDNLRPELRMVTVLHYYVNMPVQSIAKFLGVSDSTVNALLTKAKSEIYTACESERPEAVPVSAVPVLTALMQEQMSGIAIDNSDIRDMFIYIQDIFGTFRQGEAAKGNISAAPSGGEYFRSTPSVPSKPSVANSYGDEEHSGESEIDFDRFTEEPERRPSAAENIIVKILNTRIAGKKVKEYNLKKIGIIAGAVLLAFIVIMAIASHAGKNKNKPQAVNNDPGASVVNVKEDDYKWIEGGFEECTDLAYLDNNAAVFKYAPTGKYGLIDYQGKIMLQPIYDGFKRCSEGRDYSKENATVGASSYHTLYTKDGTDYYVFYENNVAIASDNPHSQHGYNRMYLDSDVKYDERDRYYEGLAAAEKDGKWGYISLETDKKVIPYEYEAVNDLNNAGSSSCDYCRPFTDGLAPVKKDGYMGIINTKNDIIVPFEYTDILVGSNGVFIARKDGVWGVILVGNAINTFSGVNIKINAVDDGVPVNEQDAKTYICAAESGINVRSDAGVDFEKIGELASGNEVTGYGTKAAADNGKEWLKIKYEDGYGYVLKSYMIEKDD